MYSTKLKVLPITQQTYDLMLGSWLKNIKNGFMTAVISYPMSDRQRRIVNMQNDVVLQKKYLKQPKKYLWITVDLRVDLIDNVRELELVIIKQLEKKLNVSKFKYLNFQDLITKINHKFNYRIVMILIGCENIVKLRRTSIMVWLIHINRLRLMELMLFFENNIFLPEAISFFSQTPAFQPRIYFLSNYENDDANQFISRLEDDWKIKVKSNIKASIIKQCAGILLFIKEAVWYLVENPNATMENVLTHQEMFFNLATFWVSFEAPEKELLKTIAYRENIDIENYSMSIKYLLATKIILKQGRKYIIASPLFFNYIKNTQLNKKGFNILNGHVFFNNTLLTPHLTEKERDVLIYTIEHAHEIIRREKMAQLLWPDNTEEHYSDWAIDAMVYRLRKKLTSFGFNSKKLVSKKGEGIILYSEK